MKTNKIRMTGSAYEDLKKHLFPGDKLEAVAFALCGYLETNDEEIFTVHEVFLYPHDKCTVRHGDRVEWSPVEVVDLFESCRKKGFRLLKIHCHPEHWPFFSEVDDASDRYLSETATEWTDRNENIASAIMLPNGVIFGRFIDHEGTFTPVQSIVVIGDNIQCFYNIEADGIGSKTEENDIDEVQLRTKQAFGEGTVDILKQLKVGVVGCSGTGSIVVEQLARLGVGTIVLIDHDKVERKNINRILNSTLDDSDAGLYKVDMLKDAIERIGTNVNVTAISDRLHSFQAYSSIAACDIVFGCMDTVDGRHLLNRIATYFCIAYFDIGVRLDADGKGGINEILGRVDYLQPGKSSLLSRGRYTMNHLKSADMIRTNPEEHDRQVKEGYIKSANVQNPAVISVNMMFSSQAVTELLARLHPFRDKGNQYYAAISFSVSGFLLIAEKDITFDAELKSRIGLGHRRPILDSPMLTQKPQMADV